MIERVNYLNVELAVIIRSSYQKEGIEFLTGGDSYQQLGYMNRPKGYIIEPHVHNKVRRDVYLTQEVLYIKSGKVRVDFYSNERSYAESRELSVGDVILLAQGGHGIEMLEAAEIIEVKQGPYIGEADKVRFEGAPKTELRIINER